MREPSWGSLALGGQVRQAALEEAALGVGGGELEGSAVVR